MGPRLVNGISPCFLAFLSHHCKVFVMGIVKKLEEKNSGVKEGDQ